MIEPSSIENLKAIIDISDVISSLHTAEKIRWKLCVRMSISQR